MDGVALVRRTLDFLKKYRYVVIVLLAGVLLMMLPGKKQEPQFKSVQETPSEETHTPDTQEALADILSQIDGAGQVRVLLTKAVGETTIYQTDEDAGSNSIRTETVILSDSERGQEGLVRQVNPPIYQGAVILCQGADSAAIRLMIVEAVADATGLTADKISVLKMK